MSLRAFSDYILHLNNNKINRNEKLVFESRGVIVECSSIPIMKQKSCNKWFTEMIKIHVNVSKKWDLRPRYSTDTDSISNKTSSLILVFKCNMTAVIIGILQDYGNNDFYHLKGSINQDYERYTFRDWFPLWGFTWTICRP